MDETRKILSQSVGLTIAVVIALATAIGAYYWYSHRPDDELAATPPARPDTAQTAPAPKPATPASVYQYPIDEGDADHTTTLEQSDGPFLEALTHLGGWRAGALRLLVPSGLIRHIVATVDALPHEKLPLSVLPTHAVPGSFQTRAAVTGASAVIASDNDRRYGAFVEAFTSVDTRQLIGVYRHFYPLFQQAYRELGYPTGYFNDRLIEVIDDLLEAPEPKAPIEVVAPRAMYHYVDPDLEALSAGQKILVRLGPGNAALVKGKLREIRQAITAPR